LITIPNWFLHP